VRQAPGVLGVFDPAGAARAPAVMGAVSRGLASVSATVPVAWSRTVVVYALSDLTIMESLDDVPGGEVDRLDGVAFSVLASAADTTVASTRFALHPRQLARAGPRTDRLVRHELTHVALGVLDDDVPVWLSEGLAEWVSVQPIPPDRRKISRPALRAARVGLVRLPDDQTFSGFGSAENYGVAWFACDHVAATYGVPRLWALLRSFGAAGAGADEDAVLQEALGIGEQQLAEAAAARIVLTYDALPTRE
jgi:hypothetical protein